MPTTDERQGDRLRDRTPTAANPRDSLAGASRARLPGEPRLSPTQHDNDTSVILQLPLPLLCFLCVSLPDTRLYEL